MVKHCITLIDFLSLSQINHEDWHQGSEYSTRKRAYDLSAEWKLLKPICIRAGEHNEEKAGKQNTCLRVNVPKKACNSAEVEVHSEFQQFKKTGVMRKRNPHSPCVPRLFPSFARTSWASGDISSKYQSQRETDSDSQGLRPTERKGTKHKVALVGVMSFNIFNSSLLRPDLHAAVSQQD